MYNNGSECTKMDQNVLFWLQKQCHFERRSVAIFLGNSQLSSGKSCIAICFLFFIYIQLLGIAIKSNSKTKNNPTDDFSSSLNLYADNLSIILDGETESLNEMFTTMSLFLDAAGLHVNLEKTKAVWIGSRRGSDYVICPNVKSDWTKNKDCLQAGFDIENSQMQISPTSQITSYSW